MAQVFQNCGRTWLVVHSARTPGEVMIQARTLTFDSNSDISRPPTRTLAVNLDGCLLIGSCPKPMRLASRSLTARKRRRTVLQYRSLQNVHPAMGSTKSKQTLNLLYWLQQCISWSRDALGRVKLSCVIILWRIDVDMTGRPPTET